MAAQLQLPWMDSSVAIGDIVIYFLCCLVGGRLEIDVVRLLLLLLSHGHGIVQVG